MKNPFQVQLNCFLGATALIFASCSQNNMDVENKVNKPTPPVAEKIPHELSIHEDVRVDNYYWLNQREDQKVLDYLNAENAYAEEMLSEVKPLQDTLYNEIVGRIQQTDMSVPYNFNGYSYYTRYEEGKEYALYCRKFIGGEEEQVMLNENELAANFEYYDVGGRSVSPNNELLAYGEDTVSRRIYTIRIKDLESGQMLPDVLEGTTGGAVWANDNKTLFYTVKDPVTLRSYKIFRHTLGTPQSEDEMVYEEVDQTFSAFVYKSKSQQYIFIGSSSTVSDEYRFLAADNPNGQFSVIQPRERNLEYGVSHYGNEFYIVTNLNAKNFKVVKTPVQKTSKENWIDVIPAREEVYVSDIELFNDYLVIEERENGLTKIRIKPWTGEEYYLDFQDAAYMAYISTNLEFNTETVRYGYTSLVTPNSIYDYNMSTRQRRLLKRSEVVGGYNPQDYESERLNVTASDGTEIPMSVVYKKGFKKDGTNPVLLYGYGSYGASMDPYFSSTRLSLLDRGFAFAIAHVRGGQELGRDWYEQGKMLNKKNSFTDFINCGEYLIENQYAGEKALYAMGGSAGGLLMGAVINMKPELWNGVVAQVPFVDVVTTMLDESIPLTTGEYDEWGNPNNKEYYDYIKSYSPYDNVTAQNYPALLVTTGLHDSQVQYWEPAKWVAKLRDTKTDDNPLLLVTNMDAGHGGASGRFQRYKEVALEYSFLLLREGIKE